jgi:hypothetical protein
MTSTEALSHDIRKHLYWYRVYDRPQPQKEIERLRKDDSNPQKQQAAEEALSVDELARTQPDLHGAPVLFEHLNNEQEDAGLLVLAPGLTDPKEPRVSIGVIVDTKQHRDTGSVDVLIRFFDHPAARIALWILWAWSKKHGRPHGISLYHERIKRTNQIIVREVSVCFVGRRPNTVFLRKQAVDDSALFMPHKRPETVVFSQGLKASLSAAAGIPTLEAMLWQEKHERRKKPQPKITLEGKKTPLSQRWSLFAASHFSSCSGKSRNMASSSAAQTENPSAPTPAPGGSAAPAGSAMPAGAPLANNKQEVTDQQQPPQAAENSDDETHDPTSPDNINQVSEALGRMEGAMSEEDKQKNFTPVFKTLMALTKEAAKKKKLQAQSKKHQDERDALAAKNEQLAKQLQEKDKQLQDKEKSAKQMEQGYTDAISKFVQFTVPGPRGEDMVRALNALDLDGSKTKVQASGMDVIRAWGPHMVAEVAAIEARAQQGGGKPLPPAQLWAKRMKDLASGEDNKALGSSSDVMNMSKAADAEKDSKVAVKASGMSGAAAQQQQSGGKRKFESLAMEAFLAAGAGDFEPDLGKRSAQELAHLANAKRQKTSS